MSAFLLALFCAAILVICGVDIKGWAAWSTLHGLQLYVRKINALAFAMNKAIPISLVTFLLPVN